MASIRDIHSGDTYTGRTPESIVRRVYGRTATITREHGTSHYTVTRRAPRKHGDNARFVLGIVTIER